MKKILIIDDDIDYTPSLKKELEFNDFEVNWIDNAEKAMDELYKANYDAIILDIMMPVPQEWTPDEQRDSDRGLVTGVVLFNKIRDKHPFLPIIIYTCKGEVLITDDFSNLIRKPELNAEIIKKLDLLIDKYVHHIKTKK